MKQVDSEPFDLTRLAEDLERVSPSDYLTAALDPDRPYAGQSHTDNGVRGQTVVSGLTFRDLKDCFIVGAFHSSGLLPEEYPKTIFELSWESIDPIAVWQNMSCEIERRMGIYPNIPK